MSPEMLNGEVYSYGIDYYSLGAVLFEMVTGLPPFYSTDQNEMFMNVLYKDLDYPSQYISPKLQSLLKLMLNKNPSRRVTKGQISLIKNHPWCKDIDWDAYLAKKVAPPNSPSISQSNFDPEYVRETSTYSKQTASQKVPP
jgi:serine/threonine protein kinase